MLPEDIFNQDNGTITQLIPFGALLPLQGGNTTPQAGTVEYLTGLLVPDYRTDARLSHFHESLYDLSETSHLVRLMRALLGDAGTGQLRKRSLVARLQNTLAGSRFFDLDRFYGAIFGVARKIPEILPVDPMESTATPDEWDEMEAADAAYRNRVIALARAIPMGGTIPGLTTAAEALTGVDCDIYETWPLIDAYGAGGGSTGRPWDDVETDFPLWSDFPPASWAEVEDAVLFGRSGTNSRSEFVVRVKKEYPSTPEGRLDRAEDELALIQVLGKLKPASVLMTVDPDGLPLHRSTQVANIVSDSDYWEIVPKVSPRGTSTRWAQVYPHSLVRVKKGLEQEQSPRILPKPPLTRTQGREWDYNSLISAVTGYTLDADGNDTDDANFDQALSDEGFLVAYGPEAGVANGAALLGARSTGDGMLVSHPYAGAREIAVTVS
jgi:hypothetical protein